MTPKDKAKELIHKYLRVEDGTYFYWEPYYDTQYTDEEVLDHAKKCALITTKEVILLIEFDIINDPSNKILIDKLNFWDKVMEEIKNYVL